jgi:hypothetical protein
MTKPPSLPWLRAQVERFKAKLEDLKEFEAAWDQYALALSEVLKQMAGREPRQIPETVRPILAAAEKERINVVARACPRVDRRALAAPTQKSLA